MARKSNFNPEAAVKNFISDAAKETAPEKPAKTENSDAADVQAARGGVPEVNAIIKAPLVVAVVKDEKRNKDIHILVKPSTFSKTKRKCRQTGVSFNECVNQLLENWANE